MSIVLNETKQAKHIIEKGEVGNKPASTLFLLGKYYSHKEKLDKDQIFSKLNEFMQKHYNHYNPALWEDLIEDISKKAAKYSLREVPFIGITQSELDKITEVHNLKYQQLLFTMLCYAKLYNILSENNNGWVNTPIQEIYKAARVTVKYKNDKFLYLNDMEAAGFISFSNRNDNLNIRINFTDRDRDPVLNIEDFRELGYEYLNFIGKGTFIRCTECNRLIKRTGRNSKYCSICGKKKELEKYKRYNKTRQQPLF